MKFLKITTVLYTLFNNTLPVMSLPFWCVDKWAAISKTLHFGRPRLWRHISATHAQTDNLSQKHAHARAKFTNQNQIDHVQIKPVSKIMAMCYSYTNRAVEI